MDTKIGLFKQLGLTFWGVINPNQFNRLRTQGFFKQFLFIVFISFFSSFLTVGILGIQFNNDRDFQEWLESAPTFSLENSILTMPEPYEQNDSTVYIYADTSYTTFTTNDLTTFLATNSTYTNVVFISQTNIVMYSDYQTNELYFSDLTPLIGTAVITNSNIDDIINKWVIIFIIFAMVGFFIFLIFALYLSSLFYGLAGLIIKSITHKNYTFKEIFSMVVFINGLGFLIMAIPSVFSLPTFGFKVLAFLFTLLYLFIAMYLKTEDPAANDYHPMGYVNSHDVFPSSIPSPMVDSSATIISPITPEVPFNSEVPKESSTGFSLKQD